MKRIWIWLAIFLLPLSCMAEKQLTLTFVGDCTIGGEDRLREEDFSFDAYLEKHGYDYFFEKVQSVIGNDDVTVANLESVLSDTAYGRVEKTYNFRGPRHYVNVLTKSSVEAVNIANNHTFDYGGKGVNHTANTLDEAGQGWFGSNDVVQRTWVYEKDGIRIGFLGYEIGFWGYQHRPVVEKQIRSLKEDQGCQVVVAVMHGGVEYDKVRHVSQEKCAQGAIKCGADLVIGHHPHVLQGLDVVDGKTICYSLGNFVFGGNAKIRAPYTALFQFTLHFDDENNYLGHQLTIIPALPSGERAFNNYQPVLAVGEDALRVMEQIQYDTPFALEPYVEGVGAVQQFVPAVSNK